MLNMLFFHIFSATQPLKTQLRITTNLTDYHMAATLPFFHA